MTNPAAPSYFERRREERQRRRMQAKLVRQGTDTKHILSTRLKSILVSILRYALLIVLSYLVLSPILKMISKSLMSPSELGSPVSIWIPGDPSTEHIDLAVRGMNYRHTLPFTILMVLGQVVLQIFTAMLAGYSFARLKFRGQKILFACVILTIVVPAQAISLPQYLNFLNFDILGIFKATTGKPLNLLNNPLSLFLLSITGQGIKTGLFIYIFRQGFRSLPSELEESAFVDGSGYLRTFFRIVLPCIGSTMLTVFVLAVVWNWNNMYFVNLFAPKEGRFLMVRYIASTARMDQTLNSIVRGLGGQAGKYELPTLNPLYQQAVADTMSLLVMTPLIVFYLLIQRRFVQSAEHSGIKG